MWTELIRSDPDMFDSNPFEIGETQPAWTTAGMLLLSFIPFSALSGYLYFVALVPVHAMDV